MTPAPKWAALALEHLDSLTDEELEDAAWACKIVREHYATGKDRVQYWQTLAAKLRALKGQG